MRNTLSIHNNKYFVTKCALAPTNRGATVDNHRPRTAHHHNKQQCYIL